LTNPLAALCSYLQIDRSIALRAFLLALSAWLAFAIAAGLHVQNAYWAAMPVWVVAQASRGLLLERAFFRIIGTLLGAAGGFAILHIPGGPYLQLALLGLFIALSAGLTHILPGVQGYAALLSGMTAAIIVIPSMLVPEGAVALALARLECTLIGVVVVTVVTGLLTPRAPHQALYDRLRCLSGDALRLAAQILEGNTAGSAAEERRIIVQISEIEASAPLTLAGSFEGYRRLHDVNALVVGLLAIMSAALALRQRQIAGNEIAEHLRIVASRLKARDSSRPGILPTLLEKPCLERLSSALATLLEANDALLQPGSQRDGEHRRERLAPHREWLLARRTGLLAGLATFAAAALGMASGSPAAMLGAMGVCIFAMVLGSMPLPQVIAPKMLAGALVGALFAVFYRFCIQPSITTTPDLLLSMAPFLLLAGFARASPRTAIPSVDAIMCFLLASQAGTHAVASTVIILGDAATLFASALLVAGSFILLPRRAERQAEEAVGIIRRDLQRMTESPSSDDHDWHARAPRQILRLALHLGRARTLAERWPNGMLAVLNLGYGIEQLHTIGEQAAPALALLKGMADDPLLIAGRLCELATATGDTTLRALLLEVADNLEQSAGLLGFSAEESAATA